MAEAKRLNITSGLKKNCELRWYALILLCLNVTSHRTPLTRYLSSRDAQQKVSGLSAVSSDVIAIVLHTPEFWLLVNQLTRITKPIVDTIGNCESRQATPADKNTSMMVSQIYSLKIDDKTFHEFHHSPFVEAVHPGVGSVMCAYNKIS
ncbi:DUF659 domain-containing protein [Mycena venus]|uniref:DUF659 domain-containing protein n=1 Tax=Mycena venus TaxID=2733690 RepID=A0A8H6XR20_9AGAR|nr:DUF659 domain-containing protein [Mycena venus]